nr:MAG TPA: TRAF TRAF-type zinc finger [Caudoviricetes sp.]
MGRRVPVIRLYADETPPETCPIHGCPLCPARPIPCPDCAWEALTDKE